MNPRVSFRSKILLLAVVPLAIAQAVTLFAMMRTVERDVEDRARDTLRIGGAVVNQYLQSRAEQLRTSVRVLAADFGLKEAVATRDSETVRSVLINHSDRVGAQIALLFDADGRAVAGSEPVTQGVRRDLLRLIQDAEGETSVESTLVIGVSVYHAFTVPVRAPLTIGWVTVGFEIDQKLIDRLGGLTGIDVSAVLQDDSGSRIIASTGPLESRAGDPTVFTTGKEPYDQVVLSAQDEEPTLRFGTPFVPGDHRLLIVLQRSLHDAMRPYTEVRKNHVVFGLLLLGIVSAGAAWLAATVAGPLRNLSAAARSMIRGDYARTVTVDAGDEIGELATSFNAMRSAIYEREQRISYQAMHDSLTGLPNRIRIDQVLTESLEKAQAETTHVTILSIRLVRMGQISSTLGHSASDEVVVLAARHLQANLEPRSTLGHIGTNEFVLIAPATDTHDAFAQAEKIETILGAGVTLGRVNIALQTEIGIASFPEHGTSAAELLRHASIARSEASGHSRRVAVYQTGREDHYVQQLKIVNDLRSATQRDEIHVYFQPKISLPDGAVCGAEALVRWQHAELGWLTPDRFIPAAEQSGTIMHLTRHVIARSLGYCRAWREAGVDLQVSVNLSARDLQDEYLPYYLLQLLKENTVSAARLTLEITENSVMEDLQQSISVLECLRDIGVRIAMDDFGTGHSSLAQIRNIPLDELKIDKSFVMTLRNDRQNAAIVRTIIELAHNMGLNVVAEGIEDEETLRRISAFGCEQAQGYFLSEPVPFGEFLSWVRDYAPVVHTERRSSDRAFAGGHGSRQ